MTRAPVSVVIPCFEAGATVERALRSVEAQTRPPEEIILVDDGSSPAQAARLEALASRATRFLVLPQNRGPASARNAGWAEARQRYVAFLDADDVWHPRKLELQTALMESDPAAEMSGHRVRVLSREEEPGPWPVEAARVLVPSVARIVVWNPFATPSVMLRREIPFRFRDGKRHVEDHALWMQMALSGCRMLFLDTELAALYKPLLSSRGQSSNLWKMALGELDAYWDLHRAGKTGKLVAGALCGLSVVKFLRRVLVVRGLQPAMSLFQRGRAASRS
jgi:glycosyltransferase involved in cell wall biosynthesis